MKINKFLLPVVASAMLFTGCDDQIMEWGLQDGHTAVTSADLPLAVKEVLANYDDIKTYSAANHPNMKLGLGVGMAIYMGEDGRHELAKDNFQMVTWGNAMKMDAIVANSGALNFGNLDPALKQLKDDGVDLYGHNFFWHTQQNQTYLKSLIAPTFKVETDGDIANILKNGTFDTDISGWMGWGGSSTREWDATGGVDGSGAAKIYNPKAGNLWDVQFCQDVEPLIPGVTYVLRFKARTDGSGRIQVCAQQPSSSYPAIGYETFEVGTDWVTCEKEITYATEDGNSYTRICINTGGDVGTYWIDNVEFGTKITNPDAHRTNLLKNGEFDADIAEWQKWNGDDGCNTWNSDEGNRKAGCLQVVNAADNPGNQWKVQIHANFINPIPEGTKFYVSYYIKVASGTGSVRCSTTGKAHYQGDQAVNTDWQRIEWEVTAGGDIEGLNFDLAQMAGTYLIDDIVVSLEPFTEEAAGSRRASRIVYTFKTAEEKAEILTDAMEAWVKGMAEHLAEKGIVPVGYDVINEAIADGSNGVRGYNGVFGGSWTEDETTYYDAAPTETEADGLTLNWGPGHWYWGYFVPDYPVKAFQFARKYLPAETKLFYNDYNLESSDSKRAAAIQFVKDIDAANGSAIVDGIGTQMHVSFSPTDDAEENATKVAELRARVDKMFQELAATGKLVRVTELDIVVGTGSPSAAQYKAQSDAYKTIFESYFENVPEAQQSGITIWSLTDAEDEHEYWLSGQKPNLWDESFKRKWAYKGVCDALAGEDVGLTFGSETYKAYYEKNNVSSTVQ